MSFPCERLRQRWSHCQDVLAVLRLGCLHWNRTGVTWGHWLMGRGRSERSSRWPNAAGSSGELPARCSGLARAGNSGREGRKLTQPEEGGLQCLRLVRCTEANPSLGDYWKSPPQDRKAKALALAPCIFNFAPAIRVELTHLALLMRFYSPMSPYQLIMPCSAMPNHMRTLLSSMSCQ